jgi:hypothetical protein
MPASEPQIGASLGEIAPKAERFPKLRLRTVISPVVMQGSSEFQQDG